MQTWTKKTLIECVVELKEDIREADEGTLSCLSHKLARNKTIKVKKEWCLFMDSFLTNMEAVQSLEGYNVLKVVSKPCKSRQEVSVLESASYLRDSSLLLLSADAILRNGGILCASGGLMLAIAAKELGVPVLAVSRSYCLWEHIICGQESLTCSQNGRAYFEDEEGFRVCIGKQYDYVGPELIKELLGEGADWENRTIVEIFEDYYQ